MATKDRFTQGNVTRRTFLASSASAGLMLSMGVTLTGCSREDIVTGKTFEPNMWIEISDTGAVQVNIPKAEMGQHVGTALARIIADELGADWDDVAIHHADSDPKWGVVVPGKSLGSEIGRAHV